MNLAGIKIVPIIFNLSLDFYQSSMGLKFRRQFPIGPYVVDFVCLSYKLVIELDGGQHVEQIDYDNKRT